MNNYMDYLGLAPYVQTKEEKKKILTARSVELMRHHMEHCNSYRKMMNAKGIDDTALAEYDGVTKTYEDMPFLPVRLFKELELRSVPTEDIVKTMTSSGTSGQAVSKIFLNKNTASNQQKVMVKIVSDFTGSARMPMLILDCPSVVKNRKLFSARGAGILGFSIFGSDRTYALRDEDMSLDIDAVAAFLDRHKEEPVLLFGFTFMIWQHFYKELVRFKNSGKIFDLAKGILIHGGGWKKLAAEAVSPSEFKEKLHDVCNIKRVHDYYGMVEQTGCIYMECEYGHLHASVFSDVIARRASDFSICGNGEKGILQVVSSIPESYPGHSLLTEDEGIVLGEDDCPCGRKGKYFKIIGRIKRCV